MLATINITSMAHPIAARPPDVTQFSMPWHYRITPICLQSAGRRSLERVITGKLHRTAVLTRSGDLSYAAHRRIAQALRRLGCPAWPVAGNTVTCRRPCGTRNGEQNDVCAVAE